MAKDSWSSTPHGPLTALADKLWRVEAPMPNNPLRRVMTVARTREGKLLLHSAIALDEPTMKQLEGLGEVAYLAVPNGFHRIDAPRYKQRYPALRVYAPRGSKAKVEERVAVDGTYEQFPGDDQVRLETLDGVDEREGVLIVRSGDECSLVFNDILFNMPNLPGVQGLVLRAVGSSGGPRVSRIAHWTLVKDATALAAHLTRLAALPGLRRIVVSHHETIDHEPAEVLRRVAATL
jgi:hypothetical protein